MNSTLVINKANHTQTLVDYSPIPSIGNNQILVRISLFSLTSNNTTYAALGSAYSYYSFYPHPQDQLGVLPVWGYGTVLQSNTPEVSPGIVLYGFFPCARYTVLTPCRVQLDRLTVERKGVLEGMDVYNSFVICDKNHAFMVSELSSQKQKEYTSLFYPLWSTSYYLADYIQSLEGLPRRVVVSSASSKTALCFAREARELDPSIELIALTSPRNFEFVKKVNLHSRILNYNQLDELKAVKCIYVDFAGNQKLNESVHSILDIARQISVGMSHVEPTTKSASKFMRSEVFFAPEHVLRKYKLLGREEATRRQVEAGSSALSDFPKWVTVRYFFGTESVVGAYDAVASGKIDGREGVVASML